MKSQKFQNFKRCKKPTKVVIILNIDSSTPEKDIRKKFSLNPKILISVFKHHHFIEFNDISTSKEFFLTWNQKEVFGRKLALSYGRCEYFDLEDVSNTSHVNIPGITIEEIPFNMNEFPKNHQKLKSFTTEFIHRKYEKIFNEISHEKYPQLVNGKYHFPHTKYSEECCIISAHSSIVLMFYKGAINTIVNTNDFTYKLIFLKKNSMLKMKGECRYGWSFKFLMGRKVDKVNNLIIKRHSHMCIYFLRNKVSRICNCKWYLNCNSAIEMNAKKNQKKILSQMSSKEIEKKYVLDVYNDIAEHWDLTRYKVWKEVELYLNNLPPYSLIGDIGCGNGKNMKIIQPTSYAIGCDFSHELIRICQKKKFEVFTADCMFLPFRSNIFDHAICIAVLHHLSTIENRLKSLKELKRITKVGGTILVAAWALENERDFMDVQDQFIGWKLQKRFVKKNEKKKEKYKRYCHLFKKGELEGLWKQIGGVKVTKVLYQFSNWYTITKKIS